MKRALEAGNEIELDRIELTPATRDLIYFACQRKARLFSLVRIIARLVEEKTPLTGFSLRRDARLFNAMRVLCVSTSNLSQIPGDPLLRLFLTASRHGSCML